MIKGDELSPQQQKFVDEYIASLPNGTLKDAALRAGYSPHTAKTQASALYAIPKIRKLIDEAEHEVARDLGVTRQRVLAEMSALAFANMQDFADVLEKNGSLKDVKREITASLVEYEKTTKRGKVKLADKLNALITLGKYLGMFGEKVDVTVHKSLEELIEDSMVDPKEETKE